ncbi:MAG: HIT family protein [Lachnospiraceae bacterium]|nr:HIT family protein [Lachnospiraceae bacterium]
MDFCIFCKIAAGEIPSVTVYEDEQLRAILDLGPAAKGHTLILPKAHYKDVTEAPAELLGHMMQTAARIGAAQMKAFGYDGFNLVQNNGEAAGQSVFHLHLHVIPRRTGDRALGLWKPGSPTQEELNETGEMIKAAL